MENTFEKLWNEYFAEECARIENEEERILLKKAAELHKQANEPLTKEQRTSVEKYIEFLYDIQNIFMKKAFLKGYKFASDLLFEIKFIGKA